MSVVFDHFYVIYQPFCILLCVMEPHNVTPPKVPQPSKTLRPRPKAHSRKGLPALALCFWLAVASGEARRAGPPILRAWCCYQAALAMALKERQ